MRPDKKIWDKMVKCLDQVEVRALFNHLNEDAPAHDPHTRQLYLALYRRLHG
jgi:hypothetical protein